MRIDDSVWNRGSEGERKLRSVFSWLTRTGIGQRAGAVPVGWYQSHQVCAIDALERRVGFNEFEVRVKGTYPGGTVYARLPNGRTWRPIGTVRDLFAEADHCARHVGAVGRFK